MAVRRAFASLLKAPHPRQADALSTAYWDALSATLPPPTRDDVAAAPLDDSAARTALRDHGWCKAPHVLPAPVTQGMLQCIHAVRSAGWPALFALALEPFWQGITHPHMQARMRAVLGPGVMLLPRLWIHRVEPGGRGWEPHADYPGPPQRRDPIPTRLTWWLALTDAPAGAACMHLIPSDAAPAVTEQFHALQSVRMEDAITLLHRSRAVPAEAGDVVAWDFSVVHWGGPHDDVTQPARVALSLELLHPDQAALPEDEPLLAPHTIPPTAKRLHLVGRALQVFGVRQAREPAVQPFLSLAQPLCDLW